MLLDAGPVLLDILV